MDFLYSLYDALVGVNVPSDKTRAVVDAMERDMGTTLTTKADLDATALLLKRDIETLGGSLGQRIDALDGRLSQKIEALDVRLSQQIEALEVRLSQKIDATRDLLQKDMELLRSSMTIRLGSIQVVSLGLFFAALRLT